jgi:hypothetical protein
MFTCACGAPGSDFGPSCAYTVVSMASIPLAPANLTLVSCNYTQIVVVAPSGAGRQFELAVRVGGQDAVFLGGAAPVLSYAPPSISLLVRPVSLGM